MKVFLRRTTLLTASLPILTWVVTATGFAQATKPVITLEKQDISQIRMVDLPESERSLAAKLPPDAHEFGAATVGETADLHELALKFSSEVKLTGMTSTQDFKIEPGGTCQEGGVYQEGSSCRLLVRFTPQGPGHRFGKLELKAEGVATPMSLGLTGFGYAPVASFTPALISTVSGSNPSSKGLISGATNLAVDDGDSLYIADTGNNAIRYLTSSGTFQNYPSIFSVTAPIGIAVDSLGSVYFTQDSPAVLIESQFNSAAYYASGSGTCAVGATCALYQQGLNSPGELAFDHSGAIFMGMPGAPAKLTAQPLGTGFLASLNITPLSDEFFYSGTSAPAAMTVDTSDNIYSFEYINVTNACTIVVQSLYSAENSIGQFEKVAGGQGSCGFSGDGGAARNAEISTTVGQLAFDLAGNLYFTDTGNQRVRRIDAATGIINTIAGDGVAGYSGDGGPAPKAALSSPTGVGVDSQGQVYILSGAAATGVGQLIRKLGPNGALAFGNQLRGTVSPATPVTLSNTGNSAMVFTNVLINGTNPGDFLIDPNTTSCMLTAGSTLEPGQSCKIGIIFRPAASGGRYANLTFLDNTVTNTNVVQLTGVGTLPVPTVTIVAPAASAKETSGTAFPFNVTVTSTTSPAPTGTVKFMVNGTAVGNPVTLVSGGATISLTETTTGTVTLSAIYNGDSNYSPAGPVSRAITVVAAAAKPASTVTLKAKTNPATTCEAVEFSAVVASSATAKATGKVELLEGSKVLATVTLSNGSALLNVPKLAAGAHVLKAEYLGDSEHAASISAAFQETVKENWLCADLPRHRTMRLDAPAVR